MVVGEKDSKLTSNGGYKSEYEDVLELVRMQGMDKILKIHNLDLRVDIPGFFEQNNHLPHYCLIATVSGNATIVSQPELLYSCCLL